MSVRPFHPPDSLRFQAAQGWLELGNQMEANEDVDNVSRYEDENVLSMFSFCPERGDDAFLSGLVLPVGSMVKHGKVWHGQSRLL